MRVLDLDLDFFLDHIAHFKVEDGSRLDDAEYIPWTEVEVRDFLENRCKLSTGKQVRGRFVTHHDEAFLFWRDLILAGKLTKPFELVHVDAHSDTGVGDTSNLYIMTELLQQEPIHRINSKKLNAGNYVSHAIACRWVQNLTFVLHPEWRNDLMWTHLKEFKLNSGAFQLKKYDQNKLTIHNLQRISEMEPDGIEPEVPYELVKVNSYMNNGSFDYIVLAQSPAFTPPAADQLIPIIMEYVCEV